MLALHFKARLPGAAGPRVEAWLGVAEQRGTARRRRAGGARPVRVLAPRYARPRRLARGLCVMDLKTVPTVPLPSSRVPRLSLAPRPARARERRRRKTEPKSRRASQGHQGHPRALLPCRLPSRQGHGCFNSRPADDHASLADEGEDREGRALDCPTKRGKFEKWSRHLKIKFEI